MVGSNTDRKGGKSGATSGRTSPGFNVKKFTIPKKQKDLLNEVDLDSSEYLREVLPIIQQGYRDSSSKNKFSFVKVQLVHNAAIKKEFLEKKRELKDEGRSEKELTESYAFLYVDNEARAKDLCKRSASTANMYPNKKPCLGQPSMGVHLCRFSDITHRKACPPKGILLLFKILKGKVKAVPLSYDGDIEPTPNYDSHVAKNAADTGLNHTKVFDSSQVYVYDFDQNEVEFRPRPRNVCPYALVHFTYSESGSSGAAPASTFSRKSSTSSNEPPPARSISVPETTSIAVVAPCFPRNDIATEYPKEYKDRPFGERYGEYSARSYSVWSGQLLNKNGNSCRVALVSFALPFLPCQLPETLSSLKAVRMKDLKLPSKIFTGCAPMLSRVKEAQANGKYYCYAELRSLSIEDSVYNRFLNYISDKELVLKKELKENVLLYILPTGKTSQKLGLTSSSHPKMMHCLVESYVPMVSTLTDVSVKQPRHQQKPDLETAPIHDLDSDNLKRLRFQSSLARLFYQQNVVLRESGVPGDEQTNPSDRRISTEEPEYRMDGQASAQHLAGVQPQEWSTNDHRTHQISPHPSPHQHDPHFRSPHHPWPHQPSPHYPSPQQHPSPQLHPSPHHHPSPQQQPVPHHPSPQHHPSPLHHPRPHPSPHHHPSLQHQPNPQHRMEPPHSTPRLPHQKEGFSPGDYRRDEVHPPFASPPAQPYFGGQLHEHQSSNHSADVQHSHVFPEQRSGLGQKNNREDPHVEHQKKVAVLKLQARNEHIDSPEGPPPVSRRKLGQDWVSSKDTDPANHHLAHPECERQKHDVRLLQSPESPPLQDRRPGPWEEVARQADHGASEPSPARQQLQPTPKQPVKSRTPGQGGHKELPSEIKEVASKLHDMVKGGMTLGLMAAPEATSKNASRSSGSAAPSGAKQESEDEKLARMRATLQSLVAERERLVKRQDEPSENDSTSEASGNNVDDRLTETAQSSPQPNHSPDRPKLDTTPRGSVGEETRDSLENNPKASSDITSSLGGKEGDSHCDSKYEPSPGVNEVERVSSKSKGSLVGIKEAELILRNVVVADKRREALPGKESGSLLSSEAGESLHCKQSKSGMGGSDSETKTNIQESHVNDKHETSVRVGESGDAEAMVSSKCNEETSKKHLKSSEETYLKDHYCNGEKGWKRTRKESCESSFVKGKMKVDKLPNQVQQSEKPLESLIQGRKRTAECGEESSSKKVKLEPEKGTLEKKEKNESGWSTKRASEGMNTSAMKGKAGKKLATEQTCKPQKSSNIQMNSCAKTTKVSTVCKNKKIEGAKTEVTTIKCSKDAGPKRSGSVIKTGMLKDCERDISREKTAIESTKMADTIENKYTKVGPIAQRTMELQPKIASAKEAACDGNKKIYLTDKVRKIGPSLSKTDSERSAGIHKISTQKVAQTGNMTGKVVLDKSQKVAGYVPDKSVRVAAGSVSVKAAKPAGSVSNNSGRGTKCIAEKSGRMAGSVSVATAKPSGSVSGKCGRVAGPVSDKSGRVAGSVSVATAKPSGSVVDKSGRPTGSVSVTTAKSTGSVSEKSGKVAGSVSDKSGRIAVSASDRSGKLVASVSKETGIAAGSASNKTAKATGSLSDKTRKVAGSVSDKPGKVMGCKAHTTKTAHPQIKSASEMRTFLDVKNRKKEFDKKHKKINSADEMRNFLNKATLNVSSKMRKEDSNRVKTEAAVGKWSAFVGKTPDELLKGHDEMAGGNACCLLDGAHQVTWSAAEGLRVRVQRERAGANVQPLAGKGAAESGDAEAVSRCTLAVLHDSVRPLNGMEADVTTKQGIADQIRQLIHSVQKPVKKVNPRKVQEVQKQEDQRKSPAARAEVQGVLRSAFQAAAADGVGTGDKRPASRKHQKQQHPTVKNKCQKSTKAQRPKDEVKTEPQQRNSKPKPKKTIAVKTESPSKEPTLPTKSQTRKTTPKVKTEISSGSAGVPESVLTSDGPETPLEHSNEENMTSSSAIQEDIPSHCNRTEFPRTFEQSAALEHLNKDIERRRMNVVIKTEDDAPYRVVTVDTDDPYSSGQEWHSEPCVSGEEHSEPCVSGEETLLVVAATGETEASSPIGTESSPSLSNAEMHGAALQAVQEAARDAGSGPCASDVRPADGGSVERATHKRQAIKKEIKHEEDSTTQQSTEMKKEIKREEDSTNQQSTEIKKEIKCEEDSTTQQSTEIKKEIKCEEDSTTQQLTEIKKEIKCEEDSTTQQSTELKKEFKHGEDSTTQQFTDDQTLVHVKHSLHPSTVLHEDPAEAQKKESMSLTVTGQVIPEQHLSAPKTDDSHPQVRLSEEERQHSVPSSEQQGRIPAQQNEKENITVDSPEISSVNSVSGKKLDLTVKGRRRGSPYVPSEEGEVVSSDFSEDWAAEPCMSSQEKDATSGKRQDHPDRPLDEACIDLYDSERWSELEEGVQTDPGEQPSSDETMEKRDSKPHIPSFSSSVSSDIHKPRPSKIKLDHETMHTQSSIAGIQKKSNHSDIEEGSQAGKVSVFDRLEPTQPDKKRVSVFDRLYYPMTVDKERVSAFDRLSIRKVSKSAPKSEMDLSNYKIPLKSSSVLEKMSTTTSQSRNVQTVSTDRVIDKSKSVPSVASKVTHPKVSKDLKKSSEVKKPSGSEQSKQSLKVKVHPWEESLSFENQINKVSSAILEGKGLTLDARSSSKGGAKKKESKNKESASSRSRKTDVDSKREKRSLSLKEGSNQIRHEILKYMKGSAADSRKSSAPSKNLKKNQEEKIIYPNSRDDCYTSKKAKVEFHSQGKQLDRNTKYCLNEKKRVSDSKDTREYATCKDEFFFKRDSHISVTEGIQHSRGRSKSRDSRPMSRGSQSSSRGSRSTSRGSESRSRSRTPCSLDSVAGLNEDNGKHASKSSKKRKRHVEPEIAQSRENIQEDIRDNREDVTCCRDVDSYLKMIREKECKDIAPDKKDNNVNQIFVTDVCQNLGNVSPSRSRSGSRSTTPCVLDAGKLVDAGDLPDDLPLDALSKMIASGEVQVLSDDSIAQKPIDVTVPDVECLSEVDMELDEVSSPSSGETCIAVSPQETSAIQPISVVVAAGSRHLEEEVLGQEPIPHEPGFQIDETIAPVEVISCKLVLSDQGDVTPTDEEVPTAVDSAGDGQERCVLKAPSSLQVLSGNRFHPYDARQKSNMGYSRSLVRPNTSQLTADMSAELFRSRRLSIAKALVGPNPSSDGLLSSRARFWCTQQLSHDASIQQRADEVEPTHTAAGGATDPEDCQRRVQLQALDQQIQSLADASSDIHQYFILDASVYPIKNGDTSALTSIAPHMRRSRNDHPPPLHIQEPRQMVRHRTPPRSRGRPPWGHHSPAPLWRDFSRGWGAPRYAPPQDRYYHGNWR